MSDIDKYADIINLPHHVSKKHKQMSLYERSAQFAPFAALTGHEAAIKETARLTDSKIDFDEEEKIILDRKLKIIQEKMNEKPKITFTYFVPDFKKDGGKYFDITWIVKKIEDYKQIIILEDKTEIAIIQIIDIKSDEIKF